MTSATRAAAAGGVTTVVDMPLNSAPVTVTPADLAAKAAAAAAPNKTYVNVAFWAGLVPANANSSRSLKALVRGGALGFKAFMVPSGLADFPPVTPADIEKALPTIRTLGVPLLVHAEMADGDVPAQARVFGWAAHSCILSPANAGCFLVSCDFHAPFASHGTLPPCQAALVCEESAAWQQVNSSPVPSYPAAGRRSRSRHLAGDASPAL
jgi:hypothetical protein